MENNDNLDYIIEDLKTLFDREYIPAEEFEEFLDKLHTDAVKHYLESLRSRSKPEQILKDVFFSHGAEFVKLFGKAKPEVFRVKTGFIDYIIERENGKAVDLEIKPPFIAIFEEERGGKSLFKGIKKQKLDYKQHKEQINKYLKVEGEYLILTDVEKWYLFSESFSREVTEPYDEISFSQFIEEFRQIGDLYKFAERKEELSIKEPLDKEFFNSLDTWVKEHQKVEFEIDDKTRDELIINLINKLIFVQCLDKLWVGPNKYFEKNWSRLESEWAGRKKEILDEFLKRTDNYFYKIYDTELFRERDGKTIFDFIKKDNDNIELFYKKLKLILGIEFGATHVGWVNGVTQYNFRLIDEDIFGKAYEKYLAKVRKEEGIYYTPKYITQYIVENTVEKRYNQLLNQIKTHLENEDFVELKKIVEDFISVKVLDPACGSGSFLIKSLKIIWKKYNQLEGILDDVNDKIKSKNQKQGTSMFGGFEEDERVNSLKEKIGLKNKRELVSKIILRHIYGNDLDHRALEVAKVNIWLEAIKLIPNEFRYDKLPDETNHILPYLEMNIGNGDSLVGLPDNQTIKILEENYEDDLEKLFELRKKYLENPSEEGVIEDIEKIKDDIRGGLDVHFKQYLNTNNLPQEIFEKTIPFYWPLDFWYVYFDESLNPKVSENRGFDIVIGNPPYVRIQVLNSYIPEYVSYLDSEYTSSHQNYDLAVIFTEKGYNLLRETGNFAYIETKKWMNADYGKKLREILSNEKCVEEIIDFGDQQVFSEATTYTALVFLRKEKLENYKYAIVKQLDESLNQLHKIRDNNELNNERFAVSIISTDELTPENWSFTLTEEKEIIEKINKYRPLSEVTDKIFVGLQTSADPIYILEYLEEKDGLIKVYSKAKQKEYTLEKGVLKPLIKGDEIKRWMVGEIQYVVLFPYNLEISDEERKATLMTTAELQEYPNIWEYLLDNKTELEKRENWRWKGAVDWYAYGRRQNIEQFEQPKIMTQVLASKASLALDNDGIYYFVGGGNAGGYGITIKEDSPIKLEYLTGLLNSKLLDWYLKKLSSRFRGGFYSYARRYIEKLPIYEGEKKEQESIIQLVNNIIELKKLQQIFQQIWFETSKKYRNDYKSLKEILSVDKKSIQSGKFDKVWTSNSSIYPNESKDLLKKEFVRFRLSRNDDEIKIYGIIDSSEELILKLKMKDRELGAIIYLSIQELFTSRKRVKKLEDIFSKTEIPVIKPNTYNNSQNLIRFTEKKLEEELNKQKFDVKSTDIFEIENEVQQLEDQIDAQVFKLYGLNKEEIDFVLNSLNDPESIKGDIVKRFEEIKDV